MSILTVFPDNSDQASNTYSDHEAISAQLEQIGVQFERWQAQKSLSAQAQQDEVISAYQDSVDRLMEQYGFQSADVVSLTPAHPDKAALRKKFLDEHTHSDFEVRFFVDGKGLFYIHTNNHIYCVLCEKGDLISVPANTTHWFDMGENPDFKCIRLFTTPEGWVGHPSGSDIAKRYPDFETFMTEYA